MTVGKAKIVGELAGAAVLLPDIAADALAANARIKFALSWLQLAGARAESTGPATDLESERALAGLGDDPLYAPPAAVMRRPEGVEIPGAGAVVARILQDLQLMLAAIEAGASAGLLDEHLLRRFRLREEAIRGTVEIAGDLVPAEFVSMLSRPPRNGHDTLHGLVMDLHRAVNEIGRALAEEDVGGAKVYRLEEQDKARVAAFMRGLNRTAPLKFDHPGLATHATRDGDRLIIQNDIGTTDAHVLIAYVQGLRLAVTYSDIHRRRLDFFTRRLQDFSWTVSGPRSDNGLDESFQVATGIFDAADIAALDAGLEQLGAKLVFLIDWNKARKSLRRLVAKSAAIAVLDWAADHQVGHRGYLEIGGDKVIADLLESVSKATGGFYISLQAAVGESGAVDFLCEALRIASSGLGAGRSPIAVRDLLRAELLGRVASVADKILDVALDHAALIHDLGNLVLAELLGGQAATEVGASRARAWETLADQHVKRIRDLVAGGEERAWRAIASAADDAADSLEETVFRLQFLPPELPQEIRGGLLQLAEDVLAGASDYVRLLCALRNVHRGALREDMRSFLDLVEALHDHEHATDEGERAVFTHLMQAGVDAKAVNVVTGVASSLEETGDALLRTGRLASDHLLGAWFAA